MLLTETDKQAFIDVAKELGIPVEWLEAQIAFETAGTYDPKIKNPNSTARGLIQFLNSTAVGLGYKDSLDLVNKHPSVSSQLRGPVLRYYKPYAPFANEKEFAFTVFLPKYRKAALDTVIYADDPLRMAKFRKANPGVVTVGDYFLKLKKRYANVGSKLKPAAIGFASLLAMLSLAYITYKIGNS